MTDEELNRRIEALAQTKSLRFEPWEPRPWEVGDGPCPASSRGTMWAEAYPKAQALRRRLIAEIEGG